MDKTIKTLVVVYDQTDVVKHGTIEEFAQSYLKQSDYKCKSKRSSSDSRTNSELIDLTHHSGNTISFVHESLWVYDEDMYEKEYGNISGLRKSIALNDDVEVFRYRVDEIFNKDF